MMHGICLLPVVPMRAEPSDCSEMVNQLLFGDVCEVLKVEDKWSWVRCLFDGYEGWVDNKQWKALEEVEVAKAWPIYVSNSIVDIRVNGELMRVPFGSRLPREKVVTIAGMNIQHEIEPSRSQLNLLDLAKIYLGSPYLWGGKTILGVDCSGFIQTIFKVYGLDLPRDASQQALIGEAVPDLSNIKLGDLVFFQNANGRVIHVGLYIDNGEIIHASGEVRVDALTAEGIYNRKAQKYTHKFHSIRRVIK